MTGFIEPSLLRLPPAYRGDCHCGRPVAVPPEATPEAPARCRCGRRYHISYGTVVVRGPRARSDTPTLKEDS